MIKDPYLAEVYKEPPLIAYKRAPNIKDKITRAKVPPLAPSTPERSFPGMNRCKGFPICPFVKQGKKIRATATTYTAVLPKKLTAKQ